MPNQIKSGCREIAISGAHVRVSHIQKGWDDTPSIRIQLKQTNGHVLQGPEIPVSKIGEVIGAIVDLLATK